MPYCGCTAKGVRTELPTDQMIPTETGDGSMDQRNLDTKITALQKTDRMAGWRVCGRVTGFDL